MKNYRIENCSGSVESSIRAQQGGAYRVELCSALAIGGLTPSYGEIKRTISSVDIKVNVMIRPRGGDFLYSATEVETMLEDIRMAHSLGADGVVFGMLTPEGDVDVELMKIMMREANGMSVTFHRAFDMCRNFSGALEELIALGCNRVLTSGGAQTAPEGMDMIASLVKQADGRIIVMPGSGINAENIAEIASKTGAVELHMSGSSEYESGMKFRNSAINMGGVLEINEYGKKMTDISKIAAAVAALNAIK